MMDMLHGDYDIESIYSSEVRDDSSSSWFQYPDDFFVSGIQFKCNDSREGYGKELYGGVHRNEHLICTWKNGKKNGEGLLYDQYGELEFRGSFQDDMLEGEGYYYIDGSVAFKVFFSQNKRDPSMYIRYTDSSTIMVEFNGDGSLSYRGGFNDDRQREGYGAEYDKGHLSSYGLYENNVSIQRLKTFSGNIMREYHSDNDDEIIYIGEYSDCIEKGFPREGEGREFADNCLLFHGFYKDNKRHGKGTCFYAHGVARMKGIWENGKCIEEKELDIRGFYKKVEYDGRSNNSIHIINDQIILNPRIVDFFIGEKMCNGEEIQKLVLRDMESIETITVGNHCFSNVSLCDIGNLPNLKSIKIGRDSFTACDRNDNKPCDGCNKDLCKEMDAKCFITNCVSLESIKVDEGAFSSFCELSLKNLPMLDTLRIGIPSIHHGGLETASYCFYWSTKFSLQDFPSLSFVEIGDFCFSNATVCLLEKLPLLSSFTAGSYSFGGLNDSYSKKVARFNNVPSLSLVSIGPKAFYYFYELVFTQIGSFEDFSIESDSFFCLKVVSCNYKKTKYFKKLFKDYSKVVVQSIE